MTMTSWKIGRPAHQLHHFPRIFAIVDGSAVGSLVAAANLERSFSADVDDVDDRRGHQLLSKVYMTWTRQKSVKNLARPTRGLSRWAKSQ